MKKNKILIILVLYIFIILVALAACSEQDEELYTVCEVTFILGDGESFVEQSSAVTGKVVKPATPEREGFTFIDWYYDSEFEEEFDFETIIESDLTLYALWEKNKGRIRFEGNGSTDGYMNELIVEEDAVLKLPSNSFSREGYSFIGWAESSNGNVKNKDGGWFYMDGQEVVTLFACWQPNKYIVKFDNQGGNSDTSQVIATYDDNLLGFAIPIKAGFIFDGYYTEADGQGIKYYDSAMQSCRKYGFASDTTLFAYWVEARNKLYFDGNGSTGGNTPYIDTLTLEDIVLPECGYSRTGYTFKEWNTCADGNGDAYSAGDNFIMPVSNDTVVLYAYWIANNYSVYYDDGIGGERVLEIHTYDVEQVLKPNMFSRYGYDFLAWSDVKDGPGNYYSDSQSVVNLCSEPNGEIVLYAVWIPKTVTVNFNKMGGSGGSNYALVTFGANFPSAISPSKVGYIFGGYYSRENGQGKNYLDYNMRPVNLSDIGEDNAEVFAYWIPSANSVIFEPNGGDGQSVEVVTSTDAVIALTRYSFNRVGYTLRGWSMMADGSGEVYEYNSDFSVPARGSYIRLYAIWSANPISLVFVGNGNDSGYMTALETFCGQQITLPDCDFAKIGYKCVGWGTTSDGSQIYGIESIYSVPEIDGISTIQLFARWELEKYVIYYDLDGGSNSPYNPSYYTYLSGEIKLYNPTKRGYEFSGWREGDTIVAGSVGDKEFVAKWEVVTYSINYIYNGGKPADGVNPIGSYTINTPTFYLPNPVKAGSVFEGWIEGNCIEQGSIGDKTFTAQWQGINYVITYNLDGGENGVGNPASYMKDTPAITLSEPTKQGYVFVGWTCSELGIETAIKSVTIYEGSEGNLTFTAHWELVTYKITYILNGGTNFEDNPTEYMMSEYDIMLYDPTRNGYIFDGWLEGNMIEQYSSGDLTFTAMWTAITYELYVFVNKQDTPDPIKFTIDSEDIVIDIVDDTYATYSITTSNGETLLNAHKNGYRLAGWYECDDDSLAMPTYTIPNGSTGVKFVSAKWELIEYSIEYIIDNDVLNSEDNPSVYTIEDDELLLQEPTREGYTFIGWENQDGELVEKIESGSVGDITLIAKWEPIESEGPADGESNDE